MFNFSALQMINVEKATSAVCVQCAKTSCQLSNYLTLTEITNIPISKHHLNEQIEIKIDRKKEYIINPSSKTWFCLTLIHYGEPIGVYILDLTG